MVALLVENNADVGIRNERGETPCDVVQIRSGKCKKTHYLVQLKDNQALPIEFSKKIQIVKLFGLS